MIAIQTHKNKSKLQRVLCSDFYNKSPPGGFFFFLLTERNIIPVRYLAVYHYKRLVMICSGSATI